MRRVKSESSSTLSSLWASLTPSDSFSDMINLAPKGRTQIDTERIHNYNKSKVSRKKPKNRNYERKLSFNFGRDLVNTDDNFRYNASPILLEYTKVKHNRDSDCFKNTEWSYQKEKSLRSSKHKEKISGNPLLAKLFDKNRSENVEHNLPRSLKSARNYLHLLEPKSLSTNTSRADFQEGNIKMGNIEEFNRSNGTTATSSFSLDQSCFDECLDLGKMCDLYQEKINFVKTLVNEMHSQFERLERDPNYYYQSLSSTRKDDNITVVPLAHECISSPLLGITDYQIKCNDGHLYNAQDCSDEGLQTTVATRYPAIRRAWWVEDYINSDLDEQ